MKIRNVTPLNTPVHAQPGDSITVEWRDEMGVRHVLDEHEVDTPLTINQIVIAELEPGEFGFKAGLAAILGERA